MGKIIVGLLIIIGYTFFLDWLAGGIVDIHTWLFSINPTNIVIFLGKQYEVLVFNYLFTVVLLEFLTIYLVISFFYLTQSRQNSEMEIPESLKTYSYFKNIGSYTIKIKLSKGEINALRFILFQTLLLLLVLTFIRVIIMHFWLISGGVIVTQKIAEENMIISFLYLIPSLLFLVGIQLSKTGELLEDNIINSEAYKRNKQKRIKEQAEKVKIDKIRTTEKAKTDRFKIANKECINRIERTRKKADEVTSALQMVTTADYLSAEEKEAYLKHINESNQLYQTYLTQNTDVFFRLNLAQIKEELSQICTAVYKNNEEIDGDKLAKLHTQFTNLTQHQYWQYTTNFEEEKNSLHNLFNELIKLDKKEELEKKLAKLSPIKDMKITQSKTLEELLEQADLQSVETIDFILSELKTNSSIFEKELARLEAENDVMKRFEE